MVYINSNSKINQMMMKNKKKKMMIIDLLSELFISEGINTKKIKQIFKWLKDKQLDSDVVMMDVNNTYTDNDNDNNVAGIKYI